MAEASISVDQEQFSCSVCLDLLKDPVTINCGHSFCMVCINNCWDQDETRGVYSCPQCRETFTPRPVLRKNNMLAEVVEKLKKTELQAASPPQCYAGPGDVECDFCTGRKQKAVKSCLVCLASYCEAHLKPHNQSAAFKKHKLIKASARLQEKICSQHGKLIEIYCRTDQSCICYLCMMDEHKRHDTVSAASDRPDKQAQLKEMQRKSQQKIQEKEKNVLDLKQAVDTLKHSAQAAVEDSDKIFTELISSIEKKRSEVREMIRAQEKEELSRAEGLLGQLEQEIVDLKKRDTELEQLSHTDDDTHFLQSFHSLSAPPVNNDTYIITDDQQASFGHVTKSLRDLREQLDEFYEEEVKTIFSDGNPAQSSLFQIKAENPVRVKPRSDVKPTSSVHHGIRCDGCQMSPIRGPRFKCRSCYNFDFCENCVVTREHGFIHTFDRYNKPVKWFQ